MGLFSRYKEPEGTINPVVSNQIQLLREEVRALSSKVTRLDAEILDVATAQEIIRNKVLRKIQGKKKDQEAETETDNFGFTKVDG